MYVKRIFEDDWSGVRNRGVEYQCAEPSQVVAAVRMLNGRNKTSVVLESDAGRSLTISGGNDGRYIAFVTVGVDDEFYNLVRPEEQSLDVVTGGQLGSWSARQIVDIEAAIEAAR